MIGRRKYRCNRATVIAFVFVYIRRILWFFSTIVVNEKTRIETKFSIIRSLEACKEISPTCCNFNIELVNQEEIKSRIIRRKRGNVDTKEWFSINDRFYFDARDDVISTWQPKIIEAIKHSWARIETMKYGFFFFFSRLVENNDCHWLLVDSGLGYWVYVFNAANGTRVIDKYYK